MCSGCSHQNAASASKCVLCKRPQAGTEDDAEQSKEIEQTGSSSPLSAVSARHSRFGRDSRENSVSLLDEDNVQPAAEAMIVHLPRPPSRPAPDLLLRSPTAPNYAGLDRRPSTLASSLGSPTGSPSVSSSQTQGSTLSSSVFAATAYAADSTWQSLTMTQGASIPAMTASSAALSSPTFKLTAPQALPRQASRSLLPTSPGSPQMHPMGGALSPIPGSPLILRLATYFSIMFSVLNFH
jgi:hypothetical protein